MPARYTYKLNGQEISFPENWSSLILGYAFDGKVSGPTELTTLNFCDAKVYNDWIAQLEEVPCFEALFAICYACHSQDGFKDIFYNRLRYRDVELNCNTCEISVTGKKPSILSDLQEGGGDEKCFNTNTQLELFQVQSGGTYYDSNRETISGNFISLVDLVNQFAEQFSFTAWEPLNGLACNDSSVYVPAQAVITPAALPTGVTEIEIVGEFGQAFNITIDPASYSTIDEYLQQICNAINCVETDSENIVMPDAWAFHQGVACCDINGGTLTINAYWDFESFTLTEGGSVPAWFNPILIPQQKSSRDIYVSGNGLFGDQICLTWQELEQLVCKLQGGIIRESYIDDQFRFSKYSELKDNLPNTGVFAEPITSIEANDARKKFDLEWWKNQFSTGWGFRVDDFQGAVDGTRVWNWFGEEIEGPVFTIPDNCITFAEPCKGRIFGRMVFENTGTTSQSVVVNIYHDVGAGKVLLDSATEIVPPNSEVEILLGDGFPNFSVTEYFTGDRICVDWRNENNGSGTSTGADITATDDAFWFFLCTPAFEYPFLNEDTFYQVNSGRLDRFKDCVGEKECIIEDRFYGGLGFAISQQVQGLADYEDTNFITYCNPDGTARRFEKCFHFNENDLNVCESYRGRTVTFYYYNAPLQLPNMISNFLSQIPSGVDVPAYQWDINVDASGNVTKTRNLLRVVIEDDNAPKGCILTFETCAKPDDVIAALQYGSTNIDICGEEGTAIINSFAFNTQTNTGTYEVLI